VLRIGTRGRGLCLVLCFQLAIGQGAEMGVGALSAQGVDVFTDVIFSVDVCGCSTDACDCACDGCCGV
jgi:hypothetical protein